MKKTCVIFLCLCLMALVGCGSSAESEKETNNEAAKTYFSYVSEFKENADDLESIYALLITEEELLMSRGSSYYEAARETNKKSEDFGCGKPDDWDKKQIECDALLRKMNHYESFFDEGDDMITLAQECVSNAEIMNKNNGLLRSMVDSAISLELLDSTEETYWAASEEIRRILEKVSH